MTMLRERPMTEVTRTPERFPVPEMVAGIIGLAAMALGAWMYFVPAAWVLGGLGEAWYIGMLGGGGVLLASAFGFAARRALRHESRWSDTAVTRTILALLALAVTVAVVAVLVWLL